MEVLELARTSCILPLAKVSKQLAGVVEVIHKRQIIRDG